jgi:hypothetical protein
MKRIMIMMLAFAAIFNSSCDKENPGEPIVTYPDYGKLKVGNYWIYQHFQVDSNGVATPLDVFDSCYVEKDTILDGVTYVKMVRPPIIPTLGNFQLLKDSLHYIVNNGGRIVFSSEDFTSSLYNYTSIRYNGDTIYTVNVKMEDINEVVTTPAGDFATLNYKATYQMNPQYSLYHLRFIHNRYAKDIGMVVETFPFFSSQPTTTERRLVRYYLASDSKPVN